MKIETTIKITFTNEERQTFSLAASHLSAINDNVDYDDDVVIDGVVYSGSFIGEVVGLLSILSPGTTDALCEIVKE